jgi:hypothetical protein
MTSQAVWRHQPKLMTSQAVWRHQPKLYGDVNYGTVIRSSF